MPTTHILICGCVCVYNPTVPTKTRGGREMASGQLLKLLLAHRRLNSEIILVIRSDWYTTQCLCAHTFRKVVLTSKPSSPSTPHISEIATGAFVLPNAEIPDNARLESFVVPGTCFPFDNTTTTIHRMFTGLVEAVERAAGLTLFSDAIKSSSKHICKSTKCEVIVRRFDDAQKRKAIAAPKN